MLYEAANATANGWLLRTTRLAQAAELIGTIIASDGGKLTRAMFEP